MKINRLKQTIAVGLALIVTFGVAAQSVSQDKPADNMQILRDKIRADKKVGCSD